MFGRFVPREGKFFEFFHESADLSVEAARQLKQLLTDLPHGESRARAIKDIEHKADQVTHRAIELLHKTFITPLDREDIHELITEMDNIIDFIEAASQRLYLYGVRQSTPELEGLADICLQSVEYVRKAVHGLNDLKNIKEIRKNCVEINRLENEADHILRAGVAKLFRDETDTRQLIKLKEIYELLEVVTDRCEDVANIIEGITIEYS